jgi:hypothetical protein
MSEGIATRQQVELVDPPDVAAGRDAETGPDDRIVELIGGLADARHGGACSLVRIEFVGPTGLLELLDFEPVTRSASSDGLPSATLTACE